VREIFFKKVSLYEKKEDFSVYHFQFSIKNSNFAPKLAYYVPLREK